MNFGKRFENKIFWCSVGTTVSAGQAKNISD